MEFILNIDKSVVMFFQNMHNPIMNNIASFATTLGNLGIVWIIISMALLASKKYRKAGLVSIIALIIGGIVGELILKNLFQRERPFLVMEGINTLVKKPITYSFPSGHTTSSFTAMLSIVSNVKNKYIKMSVVILATLIIISRLYLGVHFLSDIIAGILLGYISYYTATRVSNRYIFNK